jgi:hypothetical protein
MLVYASLVGPLLGTCLEIEASGHAHARYALNCSILKRVWCSTYPTPDGMRVIATVKVSNLVESANWEEYEAECIRVGVEP